MTSTSSKATKHVQESDDQTRSALAGPGPGGHKASFKSTKLARRARSFKDDFLGKISQMRSPAGGPPVRSHSPKTEPQKQEIIEHVYPEHKGPIEKLEGFWKQIELALKHFRDVFRKKIFLLLPGNGTIILEIVWQINLEVKSSVPGDSSSSVSSATAGMYQSIARLIKLCDDVLIDNHGVELDQHNVEEVVRQVEHAVKELIELAKQKIRQQSGTNYQSGRKSHSNISLEMNSQRNSLPDIPLTPRERDILEKTSNMHHVVRGSHSTESILRDSSPPPKPPLPEGFDQPDSTRSPPPLPPKKRTNKPNQSTDEYFTSETPLILERLSLRSKSPDDSISFLSDSGSLDSVLNASREEEEIETLMDTSDFDNTFEHDIYVTNGSCNSWEESSLSSSISNNNLNHSQYNYHRLSNTDSGIVSSEMYRSSYYSKRSSQQSTTSTQIVKMGNDKSIDNHVQVTVSQKYDASASVSTTTTTIRGDNLNALDVPPPLPEKTKKKFDRHPSPYDNISENEIDGEILVSCEKHQSQQSLNVSTSDDGKPPPLPMKKRHMFQSVAYSVMAYMEMFGNCQSNENDGEFTRHSVHLSQAQHWVQQSDVGLTQSCSFTTSGHSSHTHNLTLPPPLGDRRVPSPLRSPNSISSDDSTPPALPPKTRARIPSMAKSPPDTPTTDENKESVTVGNTDALPDLLEHTQENKEVPIYNIDLMEELNVDEYLVFKKADEEPPDIRGGAIDALIIQATATKNGVFTYQEAFLTTYRTFITPNDLITKLIRRYNHFYYKTEKKPRSREAFALIVRVVSDLTANDLDGHLQGKLTDFVQQLIACGELTLAKALRVKHLERHEHKQNIGKSLKNGALINVSLTPRNLSLLDFKSEQIAEQMTLLDAELFTKIEIPEVLIWAQVQNEERSPNLTLFTEHFNKMSYWARTKILQMNVKETREKYFVKFIKIMKHLRKINNFNSYLALLSALDSAPIRRLEWQKHVQEGLKEYCALIDSSSSFRAYRQALAETQPPCIPYIGLVLQDLTFVHIGSSNLLPNGMINFAKRWQQFHLVENMKKFKKCTYSFKKNERILQFFDNFDDIISEDAMWQLSETIKPRGGKKT